jgi:hypothetical protein
MKIISQPNGTPGTFAVTFSDSANRSPAAAPAIRSGDLVCRKGDYRTGVVKSITCGGSHANVQWKKSQTTLRLSALERTTPQIAKERAEAVRAKSDAAKAHYKYCGVHNGRLGTEGECWQCGGTPETIFTLGDRTVRPYDGPETKPEE